MSKISFSHEELERRRPVWEAISNLWLDTNISDDLSIAYLAATLAKSGYSDKELEEIFLWEVSPVVYLNLYSVAGEWAGFDLEWLEEKILLNRERGLFFNLFLYLTRPIRTGMVKDEWGKVKDRLKLERDLLNSANSA